MDEKGDIPERDAVKPSNHQAGNMVEELLDRGETIVHLRNGQTYELHGYDTYVFTEATYSGRFGVVYTQNEEDDEVWFYTNEIVSCEQH